MKRTLLSIFVLATLIIAAPAAHAAGSSSVNWASLGVLADVWQAVSASIANYFDDFGDVDQANPIIFPRGSSTNSEAVQPPSLDEASPLINPDGLLGAIGFSTDSPGPQPDFPVDEATPIIVPFG
ncbi:MAG: hypothetical protein AAF772_05320 [Acidobacteriota bacterium]